MISKKAINPLSHLLTARFMECVELKADDTLTEKIREDAAGFATHAGEGRCVMIWKERIRNGFGEDKGIVYGVRVLPEKGAA